MKKFTIGNETFHYSAKDSRYYLLLDENGMEVARQAKQSAGRVFRQGTNPDYKGRESYSLEYRRSGEDEWRTYDDQAAKGDITCGEFLSRLIRMRKSS
jgi:hypothetical protein